MFTNSSSHDRIVAAPTLQSGLATAETHITTQKLSSFPADLQDEAKDDAKKEKDLNDFPDLTEQSRCLVEWNLYNELFSHLYLYI